MSFFRAISAAVLPLAALFFSGADAYAQSANVTYLEGSVDYQPSGQLRSPAQIGETLHPGDSIITGTNGLADLQRQNQAQITVSPGTVFTLRQIEQGGQKRDVLAVALGSIVFKFNQLFGREPEIATASASAGIRGTELTVYAGADGTSLFIVNKGKVDVTSGGKTVDLTEAEGVQVTPGQAPGAKFKVLAGFVNYSTWNADRVKAMLADPAASALRIEKQMSYFEEQIATLAPEYSKTAAALVAARARLKEVLQKEGSAAGNKYYGDSVFPLEKRGADLFLNIRYYALSALSLRTYVLGRLYLELATRYIAQPNNTLYSSFLRVYNRVLTSFQEKVVPYLVPADI